MWQLFLVHLRLGGRQVILGASLDTKTRKNPLGKSGTYSPTLANAPGLLEAKRLANEVRAINNGHQGSKNLKNILSKSNVFAYVVKNTSHSPSIITNFAVTGYR